jgi:hypothetical protein
MNRFFAVAATAVLAVSISAAGATAGGSGKTPRIKSGHYEGKDSAGHPISFDVVRNGARAKVQNLAVDVNTECWSDLNHDGLSDRLLAHVSGLDGGIYRTGEVDVYYAPDDDTEYVVEGTIEKGIAKLYVTVGGSWDEAGMPSPLGPLQCDNWGARYKAARN